MTTERDLGRPEFGLPRYRRLLTQRDFRRVYGRGSRARGAHLVIVAFPRGRPGFRLGLSVSKAHGRAVRRNKIKRIFREAFRLERPTLPGRFDVIMIPQPRERYPLEDVRAEFKRLIQKLHKNPKPRSRPHSKSRSGAGRQRRRGKPPGDGKASP